MQNTVTALTSAISEMQTETGLTSDTMDSLRTQFSDLKMLMLIMYLIALQKV